MSQISAIATSAKISARLAAVAIFLAAGSLAAPVAVPVVGPHAAVAKPIPVVKGATRIKGKVTRGQVRRACEAVGGIGYGTAKGAKGGYGCVNMNDDSSIDCNSKGQCAGVTGDDGGKQPD